MTTPGSHNQLPSSSGHRESDRWAEQMDITTSETVSPDLEFQDNEEGAALRAEIARLNAKIADRESRASEEPQESASNKPNWLKRGIVAGSALGATALAVVFGPNLFSDKSEAGPEPTPPAETAPVVAGNEYPTEPEETAPPVEEMPQTLEDLDIPPEAEQWVDTFASRFAIPEVLPTYYADQAHIGEYGVNSAIGDWYINSYEYTTNFNSPESDLPGIKLLALPREAGLTPDGVEPLLNEDVAPMLTSYLNMTARSPGAGTDVVKNEMRKYLASPTGEYTDSVDSLMFTLDDLVQQYGSDALYEVLPFEQFEYGSIDPMPEGVSLLLTDKDRLVQSPTRVGEDGTILGTTFATNMRVAVTEYNSEGEPVNGYDDNGQPIPEIVTIGDQAGNNMPAEVELLIDYDKTNEANHPLNTIYLGKD